MHFLLIPVSRLSTTTNTTIFVVNANGGHPLEKIRLNCLNGDLKSKITCYVIHANTLYNLPLRRLCVHAKMVVLSTLH